MDEAEVTKNSNEDSKSINAYIKQVRKNFIYTQHMN
jgi:hypothetical protein